MGATPTSRMGILAVALALIALSACSPAASAARDGCRVADEFSPSALDAASIFDAITPAYIHRAFPLRDDRPFAGSQEQEINALKIPTIILVLTDQNRLTKLLAHAEGNNLLIRKSVTYPSEAGKIVDWQGLAIYRDNFRLAENTSLDLDPPSENPSSTRPDIRWEKDGTTFTVKPPNWAQSQIRVLITVPVVAHRMKSRQHANDLKAIFSNLPSSEPAKRVDFFFTLSGWPQGMNTAWAPAGILFYLQRLEDCEYSIADFPPQPAVATPPAATDQELVPWPMGDCQAQFRRVNSAYNSSDVRGLDIYLWWRVDRAMGYAASHRTDGTNPGPGAVWLDRTCQDADPPCGRVLAHEVGHFLRLCHCCVTDRTPPEDRGRCGFCPANTPACSEAHATLLMRDDIKWVDRWRIPSLAPADIERARKTAWERVSGS
jgi:hypothetical protein